MCEQNSSTPKRHVTVALDAGIATEDNLELLKSQGYDYVVVARNKPVSLAEIQPHQLLTIKNDKQNKVQVQLIKKDDENILYCKSYLKGQKEQSIKNLFQHRFEKDLEQAAHAIHTKGGTKRYDKVLERIGRLKEKYSRISQYHDINVEQKDGIATLVRWEFCQKQQAEERFSGSYYLRTTRMDLDEQEIWSLYLMLTNVEDAFRSLEFEPGLRPVYHQKEERSDGHLFITILAYHLLNALQIRLKSQDIHIRWERLRELMSSHIRVTTSFTTRDKRRIHMRKSTEPETFHRQIYNALKITSSPMKRKTVEF